MRKIVSAIMILTICALVIGCSGRTDEPKLTSERTNEPTIQETGLPLKEKLLEDEIKGYRKVHVYVALCDNKNQGIVPVPKAIGNGQNAEGNLYWGCSLGIRTFFKNSSEFNIIS